MEQAEQTQGGGGISLSMGDVLLLYARVRLERDALKARVATMLPAGEAAPEEVMSVDDLLVKHATALLEGEALTARCQQLQAANAALLAAQQAPAEMPTPILPLRDIEFREDDAAAG